MIKFKRILFPTDFSSSATRALDFALSVALEHEAELLLVHVIEDVSFGGSPSFLTTTPVIEGYEEQLKEGTRKQMKNFVSPQMRRQIQVGEIIVRGKPFVEILRLAREKAVDLIVIPSHSHLGLKHSHIGATAERVVRQAPCPVLVIRHPDDEFASP